MGWGGEQHLPRLTNSLKTPVLIRLREHRSLIMISSTDDLSFTYNLSLCRYGFLWKNPLVCSCSLRRALQKLGKMHLIGGRSEHIRELSLNMTGAGGNVTSWGMKFKDKISGVRNVFILYNGI